MTRYEKLLGKFLRTPESLHYSQIETIIKKIGFIKIMAKGSHRKYKHKLVGRELIIPVHNNECKNFYKKLVAKTIRDLI